MQKFERADFEIKEYVEDEHYGKFVMEPLERGFGTTIGNAIRRVLISSMPGGAVYSIKIEGVFHEFSSIPGVVEDVPMIILNIKEMILDIEDDESYTLRLDAMGPKTVTAGDIVYPTGVTCLNPELVICHLAEGSKIEMELRARKGRGYISAMPTSSCLPALHRVSARSTPTRSTHRSLRRTIQLNRHVSVSLPSMMN